MSTLFADVLAMQRFGEKLRVLRMQRGLTLRELAAALGYANHGYINQVELGQNQPTVELLEKVSRLFNVSADQLLRDELDVDNDTFHSAGAE